MKKIIILPAIFLLGAIGTFSNTIACPIDTPGECKADISGGIKTPIKDREIPNNLNNLVSPANTMDTRQETTAPQMPSNINMESRPQSNPMGYDANCQFGDCINKTPESEVSR